MNTRRGQFKDPRIRQALGFCFDFEWTNKNIMYGLYRRTSSYFQNSPLSASGLPGPDELKLLESFRGKVPDTVFGEAILPPVSDGSGQDRTLLQQGFKLLQAAGCQRDGNVLKLPSGEPFRIEFLDFSAASSATRSPSSRTYSFSDRRALQGGRRRAVPVAGQRLRFRRRDLPSRRQLDAGRGPALQLRIGVRERARLAELHRHGRSERRRADRKGAGRDEPGELTTICRALDRVLRSGYWWVPMWNNPAHWLAYWDQFSWPAQRPKLDPGVVGTWWYDEAKAKAVKAKG